MTDAELRALAEALDSKPVLSLLDRVGAVRALHHRSDLCGSQHRCKHCAAVWPCPTLRALDGAA